MEPQLPELIQRFVEALRPFVQPLIADEVERQVAQRLAAPVEQAKPLGIDPERLYTRQEAAKLLNKHPHTFIRAERRKDSKRLPRRGATSRAEYKGSDLLKFAKVEA